jgi:hypothetical protein
METAAHGALKELGMENARAVFAAHRDEGYSHVHIVASKLNPETGRAYDLKGNFLKLSKWAQAYERDNGGVVCLRRESANELRDANRGPRRRRGPDIPDAATVDFYGRCPLYE